MTTTPRWATKREAAEYARVHINTIDRWRAEGRLTTHGASDRVIRFDLNELDAMLTAGAAQEAN